MGCFLRLKFGRKKDTKKIDAAVAASDGTGDLDQKKEKDFDGANGCSARKYSWSEIERLSMNFSQIVGSGGFSTVYLAHLPGSSIGAIKIHCPSDFLNRVFKQELDILLQLQHDNIVKLLGYCDNQGLCLVLLEKTVSDITCLLLNLSSRAKNLSLLFLILRRRCFGI